MIVEVMEEEVHNISNLSDFSTKRCDTYLSELIRFQICQYSYVM